MNQKKVVVFIDFDGTITFKDSFIEFIKFTDGTLKLGVCLLYNTPFILLYFLKLYPNQKLKERFFSFFYKGKEEEGLLQKGKQFCELVLQNCCYVTAMEVIQMHKRKGHDIYILTASSGIWVDLWCKKNEVKLIGTHFEVINGCYTGKIKGENCYGIEKLNRIKHLLENYDLTKSYAYGDTKSDKYYLDIIKNSYNYPLNELYVNRFNLAE